MSRTIDNGGPLRMNPLLLLFLFVPSHGCTAESYNWPWISVDNDTRKLREIYIIFILLKGGRHKRKWIIRWKPSGTGRLENDHFLGSRLIKIGRTVTTHFPSAAAFSYLQSLILSFSFQVAGISDSILEERGKKKRQREGKRAIHIIIIISVNDARYARGGRIEK